MYVILFIFSLTLTYIFKFLLNVSDASKYIIFVVLDDVVRVLLGRGDGVGK